MPTKSGYEICEFVKTSLQHVHTRVVLVAGAHDALSAKLARLHNATVRVKEWHGDVVFLHEVVPGSADPGVVNGDIVEANLDVQWAGGVAPKATIVYVNSTNVFNSMFYAISQNLAPVISISYGDCEPNFAVSEINSLVAMAQQANAQGQTIVGPSGDSGAADCAKAAAEQRNMDRAIDAKRAVHIGSVPGEWII